MTTVFLSGSRKIGRLNDMIHSRIDNILERGFRVIVGDANGADKAMQHYLADRAYKNVIVYSSGSECRNNVGNWKVKNIMVNKKLRGRDFYTQKDITMAK